MIVRGNLIQLIALCIIGLAFWRFKLASATPMPMAQSGSEKGGGGNDGQPPNNRGRGSNKFPPWFMGFAYGDTKSHRTGSSSGWSSSWSESSDIKWGYYKPPAGHGNDFHESLVDGELVNSPPKPPAGHGNDFNETLVDGEPANSPPKPSGPGDLDSPSPPANEKPTEKDVTDFPLSSKERSGNQEHNAHFTTQPPEDYYKEDEGPKDKKMEGDGDDAKKEE